MRKNQVKDQPILCYAKDGIIYPVALTQDQIDTFSMIILALGPLKLVNHPMGEAVNLLEMEDSQ